MASEELCLVPLVAHFRIHC